MGTLEFVKSTDGLGTPEQLASEVRTILLKTAFEPVASMLTLGG